MGAERSEGRGAESPRTIEVTQPLTDTLPGSVLYRCGRTEILCVASLEDGVPSWREDGLGWSTGEYSLAPYSTRPRHRPPTGGRVDGRSQEIRRLIGRALRASVDLSRLPGLTLHCDCQVLHADGGTRTASINAATIALGSLVRAEQERGRLAEDPRIARILAVSVGRVGGRPLVDLDYREDSAAEIDLNIVATPDGALVEVQGASEADPIPREAWHELVDIGCRAIGALGETLAPHLQPIED
ncbi:MAG: ribonuclease PH [Planctomycetota bacterium]|jgi:ribonuclease PH